MGVQLLNLCHRSSAASATLLPLLQEHAGPHRIAGLDGAFSILSVSITAVKFCATLSGQIASLVTTRVFTCCPDGYPIAQEGLLGAKALKQH